MDGDHKELFQVNCDTNEDDIVDYCELHDCMMKVENIWRDNNCDIGHHKLYCMNPYTDCEDCINWTCDDIYEKTECALNDMDSDGNGYVNLHDAMDY
jgi:hypothetical protein